MAEDFEDVQNKQEGGESPEVDAKTRSLEQDLSAMRMVLRRTGRAWRRPILLEGALWYLVTLGAVALSAVLAAALVPIFLPTVTGWMLLIGTAAATLGALVAWVGFRASAGDIEAVAKRLQREHPAFRNDIIAALEFGEKLVLAGPDESLGFSRSMARTHVRQTTRTMLAQAQNGHLGHLLESREFFAPAMSLAACLTLLLIPFALNSAWMLSVLGSPFAQVEEAPGTTVLNRPIVGALSIYYTPPAYTHLGRQVDQNSSGYIEALIGTEVTIETSALIQNVARMELVIEPEAGAPGKSEDADSTDSETGARTILMSKQSAQERSASGTFHLVARRPLRASFVALQPASYYFRATLEDGTIVEDGRARKIKIVADDTPEILIPSHAGQVEVSPDDILDISFEISDDFGVESVWKVWHFAGDPQNAKRTKIELPELANTPREAGGQVRVDLGPLSLQPKDAIIFYFEGIDNNSMTGPGVGRSKPLHLRVSSPQDKHRQNMEAQKAILDAMIEVLADYLSYPVGERVPRAKDTWAQRVHAHADPAHLFTRLQQLTRLQANQKAVVAEMEKTAGQLKKDPLVIERNRTLFVALQKQLADLSDTGERVLAAAAKSADPGHLSVRAAQPLATYAAQAEDTFERGILRLSELLASAKMAAIQASLEEIKELKERLKTLLQEYKETQDPELKKAILRDINRLRQRMNELMSRMRAQIQELPQEHLNMDAIEQQQLESDTQKMADSLSNIEEMLENDDIDGALKALEELEMNLDSLDEKMGEQFEKAQPQGLSELDKKVNELMDDLNDIRQAETRLEKDTNDLNKEMIEKRREHIEKQLDAFTKQMLRQVALQESALDSMAQKASEMPHKQRIDRSKEVLGELKRMLEDKDIAHSLERARDSFGASQETRYSLELSRRYTDSQELKRQIDQLRAENDAVSRRAAQMVDELEKLMDQAQKELQQMDREQLNELAEQQQKIVEQAEKLQQKIDQASERFPMLEQKLGPKLEESKQTMQEAAESLRKQQTQRGLDHERQALDQLSKLQGQMEEVVEKQRQGNKQKSQSAPQQKVEIPEETGKHAGEQLRHDVMDAMKQEKLDRYQSEIERYYKSIME